MRFWDIITNAIIDIWNSILLKRVTTIWSILLPKRRDHYSVNQVVGFRLFTWITYWSSKFNRTWDKNLQHLEPVFEALRKDQLHINLNKCQFFKEELEYLGFIVS
jgi:hypothetical protein